MILNNFNHKFFVLRLILWVLSISDWKMKGLEPLADAFLYLILNLKLNHLLFLNQGD